MKIIRIIVGAGFLVTGIWLCFWVVPDLGVFHSLPADPPVPENGFALVLFKNRAAFDSLPLRTVKKGWPAVCEGWPLLIIGVMMGHPLGEYARRRFAIDEASKEAIQESREYAEGAAEWERSADRKLTEARALHARIPQLQEELARARDKIQSMISFEKSLQKSYAELLKKNQSAEKQIFKARAKIRRLVEKSKSPDRKSC
jgi:hypothetical protein